MSNDSSDMIGLPPYTWPAAPEGDISEAELERYKTQLSTHAANIEKQLTDKYELLKHEREIEAARIAGEIAENAARTSAEIAAAAADHQAKIAEHAAHDNAQIAIASAVQQVESERANSITDRTYESAMEFHRAYIEVAKGGVERHQKHVEVLQAAAVALGTLYTGLIAFVFVQANEVTAENTGIVDLLPTRGIIPTLFLGTSIVLAIAYLAFRIDPENLGVGETAPVNSPELLTYLGQQRNAYVKWAAKPESWRIRIGQLSIISLGFAIAAMPLPLLNVSDNRAFVITGIAVAVVLVVWWVLVKDKKK